MINVCSSCWLDSAGIRLWWLRYWVLISLSLNLNAGSWSGVLERKLTNLTCVLKIAAIIWLNIPHLSCPHRKILQFLRFTSTVTPVLSTEGWHFAWVMVQKSNDMEAKEGNLLGLVCRYMFLQKPSVCS